MSRAKDLASSGVTSTVLSEKAPLASPDFTGTVDFTGTTLSLDNDQISGDKVSGGTIGAGTFNGTLGNTVVRPNAIGIYGFLTSNIVASGSDESNFLFSSTHKFINGVTESGGEITLPTAGKYFAVFLGQAQTSANNNYFECLIQKKPSGGSYSTFANSGAIGYQWNVSARSCWGCSAIMQASANDVVRLRHYSQGGGGTLYSGTSTTFSVFLMES